MLKRFWQRVSAPLLAVLKQGLSPSRAALAVALGLYLGVIPALGTTILLCFLVAVPLKLNVPVIQAASFAVYPLQFLLLLPFFGWGARVFGGPVLTLSLAEFTRQAAQAPLALMRDCWWVTLHAVAVWALLGLALVPLLWAGLTPIVARVAARFQSPKA